MLKNLAVLVAVILISGCATTQGQSPMAQLQVRVGELERQSDVKDDAIRNLNHDIQSLMYKVDELGNKLRSCQVAQQTMPSAVEIGSATVKDEGIIRVSASTEEVQRALTQAGFYQGEIDGKIGARTQKAISEFQKEQALKVDGIVGQKTWDKLQGYLD